MKPLNFAIGFSCIGLVFVLMAVASLWRGDVSTGRKAVARRQTEPVRFYATVGFRLLMASLFFAVGAWLRAHPQLHWPTHPQPPTIRKLGGLGGN